MPPLRLASLTLPPRSLPPHPPTNAPAPPRWNCKSKRKHKPHCSQYGPCYVLLCATVLVMVQPVSMLVIGSFNGDQVYSCDLETDPDTGADSCALVLPDDDGVSNFFFDGDDDPSALVPNTLTGWMIQIFCTYLGFGLLFWGVTWATNLHVKIAKKWAVIRAAASAN